MSDSGIQQEIEPKLTVEAVKRTAKTRKGRPRKALKQATMTNKPSSQQLPPQKVLQSPPATSQPSQNTLHPPQTAVQPLQTLFHPLQTVLQPQQTIRPPPQPVPNTPQTILHPLQVVTQPSQAVIQPPQTIFQPPQSGSTDSNPPQGSFVQFTPLPNIFSSPLLNSTVQPPVQHAIPSSLAAPQTSSQPSTMSLLNALHDEKLGLLLPVIVRMDHKMDQLMAQMGEMGNQLNALLMASQSNASMIRNQLSGAMVGNQSNASIIANQSDSTLMGNQSNAPVKSQSNAYMMGHQRSGAMMGNQSNASMIANQSDSSLMGNQSNVAFRNQSNAAIRSQSNASLVGNQSNAFLSGNQPNAALGSQTNAAMTGIQKTITNSVNNPVQTSPNAPIIAPQSNPTSTQTQPPFSTMETQSNGDTSSDFHLNDSAVEKHGDDNETESDVPLTTTSCSLPAGLVKTKSEDGKCNKAKVTQQILSADLNFPISREVLIMLHQKSNSIMNFSVQLLRELFTVEELEGKNISGSRGKDKVDPERVEMIKEMVFKVYGTVPSDKELVWKYCRKAMDAFMRRMKREKVLREAALQNAIQAANQNQT